MRRDRVNKAIEEAERFIAAAKNVKLNMEYDSGGKESAACRRASMDLTRALADLRRSDFK